MEDRFEAIREEMHRKFDELMHKLDTAYVPQRREIAAEEPPVRPVEVQPSGTESDLARRHRMQEEALRQEAEEKDE